MSKQEQINAAIAEYLNTPELERSLTKLQEKYGVRRQTISEHLKKRGYEVVNYQNRCRIIETIFDEIDSEEKAYWLGFIYADGSIGSSEHKLEINLATKDKTHLQKFADFIGKTDGVRECTNFSNKGTAETIVRFQVRNKHLWNTLNNYGCTPRKSLTLEFPNLDIFKTEELVFDFIRGYCDGDGTLGLYNIGETEKLRENLGFVGTEKFLIKITEILGQYCKVTLKQDNNAFRITYSNKKAREVARKLYENSTIYLDRKYDIYLKFCRLEEESSRRLSSKNGES